MHRITLRLLIVLLVAVPATAFAQLKQYGPGREPVVKNPAVKNARQQAEVTLTLPFWDDFSNAQGTRANPQNWRINDKVFVNDGQAINPPSLNVATFDGYDQNGMPYSTDALARAVGDTLESQLIRLADFPVQYRDSIYLSFAWQAGGNSEMPDRDDYLMLEFKSANYGWVEKKIIRVTPATQPDKFYDVVIQIADTGDTIYFHNAFQFRFKSLGRTSGQYDAWHLDYVYLNRRVSDHPATTNVNEFDINTNISDRTTTKPFSTILPHGYYAIPYDQFDASSLVRPEVSMYSLKHVSFGQVVSYRAKYTITSYTGGTSAITYNGSPDGGETSFDPPGFEIPVLQHVTAQTKSLPPASAFNPAADSARVAVQIAINGGDNDPGKDFYLRYSGIDFRWNDTLRYTFTLSNYYAYDDGVAEYSAGLVEQGNQLAYRFVIGNNQGPQSLNGMYIYLPFTASTIPNNMRIFVFRDKAGKPDSSFVYSQYVAITRTANNVFTFIPFTGEVIVRDTFYLGYTETVTARPDRIRIGLDASHDTGQHLYYRNTVYHQWVPNDEIQGSLMMRPAFGPIDPVTGIEDPESPVSVYPNPNRGEFYLKGYCDNIQIIAITGQPVSFATESLADEKKIILNRVAPGLYMVRYRSGSKVYTNKILVKDY